MNPAQASFNKISFRNKTIAELQANPDDSGEAIIASEKHVHFPNIFGSFVSNGTTFHTCLTLIGIEDPYNKKILKDSCRGISLVGKKSINKNTTLLEFYILMSTSHCASYTALCKDTNGQPFLKYCVDSADRTEIFATEFLCLYRFFIETLRLAYENRDLTIDKDPNRSFDHPTPKEVHDLICPYDVIESLIIDYNSKVGEGYEIDSYEPFLDLNPGRKRKALYGYYMQVLKSLRVAPEIVEAATIELLAICGKPQSA